ncbi:MAG: carbohydrate kinase family protein [Ignavibacteriales bacterium]|nr:MAG: carbohydrate kinase family protein [Ignavibacteriales bacterium]
MKRLDVVVVGELNVDLILQDIPSFPELGKEKIAGNMILTMGSASAIFASNIAKLGLKVGFVGKLGKDSFADIVLEGLKSRNVETNGILQDEKVKTGITVALTFPNDYAMITHMGAMKDFKLEDIDLSYLDKARHLHFASFYLQPGMRPGVAELFRIAKQKGLTTSFDPGWDPDEKWGSDILEVLDYTDVFMPNENEAIFISGKKNIQDAAEELGKHSKVVMIKLGSKGSLCKTGKETLKTTVFNVNPVDTTGAGDSFNSGFLYGYVNGKDLKACVMYGSACGAIATTKIGGTSASPDFNEMQKFLAGHTENIFSN